MAELQCSDRQLVMYYKRKNQRFKIYLHMTQFRYNLILGSLIYTLKELILSDQ